MSRKLRSVVFDFGAIQAALTHKPSAEEAPKLLGEGSSGTVLLGRDLTKGDEVRQIARVFVSLFHGLLD